MAMRSAISKSNLQSTTTLDRLQQIRMGAHDRLLAEAHLARAEYVADVLVGSFDFVKRGLRALVLRPFQRVTAAFN
jgi:hypothetical protein